MLKKLIVFLSLMFFIYAPSSINAQSSMPEIYINNQLYNSSESCVIHSGTVYILPDSAGEILRLKLSTDEYGVIYTFSTPTELARMFIFRS